MLCYVMLCYVMLCYVMLCYVMLCYVMLCYVMLCYVMLCYVMVLPFEDFASVLMSRTRAEDGHKQNAKTSVTIQTKKTNEYRTAEKGTDGPISF